MVALVRLGPSVAISRENPQRSIAVHASIGQCSFCVRVPDRPLRWPLSSDGCFTPIPPPRGSSGTRAHLALAMRELRLPLAQERLRTLARVRARGHRQEPRPFKVQPLVEAELQAPPR